MDKLLGAGFILPVKSASWLSPIIVVPKKNGKFRICEDFKPSNVVTRRDQFSLPFQDEILDEVVVQVTFITPWGCFTNRSTPFDLTNAPTVF